GILPFVRRHDGTVRSRMLAVGRQPFARRRHVTAPWQRNRPTGAVDIATDDDDYVTIDRWPREVFRPHFHDSDFNWLVPMRAGRIVVAIEGQELAIDGDHWLCIF